MRKSKQSPALLSEDATELIEHARRSATSEPGSGHGRTGFHSSMDKLGGWFFPPGPKRPVTVTRRPSNSFRLSNSLAWEPPANASAGNEPSISNRSTPFFAVSLPAAVNSISPGVKPALLTALGSRVGSKLLSFLGRTSACPSFKLTFTFPTPSRRRRAFSAPKAQSGQVMPLILTVALST